MDFGRGRRGCGPLRIRDEARRCHAIDDQHPGGRSRGPRVASQRVHGNKSGPAAFISHRDCSHGFARLHDALISGSGRGSRRRRGEVAGWHLVQGLRRPGSGSRAVRDDGRPGVGGQRHQIHDRRLCAETCGRRPHPVRRPRQRNPGQFHDKILRPPGPITVRQLLSHTSGMPSFQEAENEKSAEDIARVSPRRHEHPTRVGAHSDSALGSQSVGSYRYSDSNYLALGQLLEKLRGKSFAQVLRDDVINRLGLGATSIDQAVRGEPDVVHGYITLRGERLDVTQPPADLGSPAFGAISTMHDVNDFFEALFRGDLVSDSSLKEMTTTGSFPYYGLGLWKWCPAARPTSVTAARAPSRPAAQPHQQHRRAAASLHDPGPSFRFPHPSRTLSPWTNSRCGTAKWPPHYSGNP